MPYELQRFPDTFRDAQDRALRMLQQAFASSGQFGQRVGRDQQHDAIVPPAEASEDDNAYLITLEIPGVDPREVDVSVVGNTLTVKAERRRRGQQTQQGQQEGDQQGQQQRPRHYLFSEIQQGVIRREFGLPEDTDRNRIDAEFHNGFLTLTIPKSQETHQRRKIEIKSS